MSQSGSSHSPCSRFTRTAPSPPRGEAGLTSSFLGCSVLFITLPKVSEIKEANHVQESHLGLCGRRVSRGARDGPCAGRLSRRLHSQGEAGENRGLPSPCKKVGGRESPVQR